ARGEGLEDSAIAEARDGGRQGGPSLPWVRALASRLRPSLLSLTLARLHGVPGVHEHDSRAPPRRGRRHREAGSPPNRARLSLALFGGDELARLSAHLPLHPGGGRDVLRA